MHIYSSFMHLLKWHPLKALFCWYNVSCTNLGLFKTSFLVGGCLIFHLALSCLLLKFKAPAKNFSTFNSSFWEVPPASKCCRIALATSGH